MAIRTTNARDIVWRIGHDRGSGGAPEAWKTYKNQNPAIWRLRGFRFGCGDMQPSQIAIRGSRLKQDGMIHSLSRTG
jgi:hypothetical protein